MELVDIRIGGIHFKASEEWIFHPTENFILARHDSQKGILKISIAETEHTDVTDRTLLLQEAESLISSDQPLEPFDAWNEEREGSLIGAASYHVFKDDHQYLTRLWYVVQGRNMVIATYGCPWELRKNKNVQEELQQCEQMILTVKFAEPQHEVE